MFFFVFYFITVKMVFFQHSTGVTDIHYPLWHDEDLELRTQCYDFIPQHNGNINKGPGRNGVSGVIC